MKFKQIIIFIIALLFLFPPLVFGAEVKSTYPRLANYFLKWDLSEKEAEELAKWDLLILDMEVQENSPEAVRLIRELNPDVIILAYITSQEIIDDIDSAAGNTGAFLRRSLRSSISDSWWLKEANGSRIMNWPGTYMLNLSNASGKDYNGDRFNDFLPNFVKDNIYTSGLFDGIFYDNTWGDVSWVNSNIDIDGDGSKDSASKADSLWAEGFRSILQKTKDLTGNDFIIVGNGRVFWDYQDLLNGMMLESFPSSWENGGSWQGSMKTYLKLSDRNKTPQLSVINVNKKNQFDYQGMRYGLVSTLLGDGFYSFDYDVTNHTQTWWYDEYSVNLGPAQSLAYNLLNNNSNDIAPGLWRRDFKFGSVLLNSTTQNQVKVFSNENFEKIKGEQDKNTNNGEKVNLIKLAPNDGIILLKTSDNVLNSTFINGYFYRVYSDQGEQVRNGFFSFSSAFPASAAVTIADGSRREIEDVSVVASQGRVYLQKNGKEIVSFFPYDKLFRRNLNIDTYINDGFFEIIAVGTTRGGGPQVRIFSGSGNLLSSFFAYDKNLRGGVSVALGDVDSDGALEVVTGAGYGDKPIVKVFALSGELENSFLAYSANFLGGVNVAIGDINGNGYNEIVTGPGPGGGPQVRIFSGSGQVLGQFFAYQQSMRDGLQISLSDINSDGKKEILTGIKNIF
jgi:hypothetical protein